MLNFNVFLIKHSKTNFPLIDKEQISQCFFIISCCILLAYKVKIEGVFSQEQKKEMIEISDIHDERIKEFISIKDKNPSKADTFRCKIIYIMTPISENIRKLSHAVSSPPF